MAFSAPSAVTVRCATPIRLTCTLCMQWPRDALKRCCAPSAGSPVTEYYLRSDLAAGELGVCGSARDLLCWALAADRRAPPDTVYRDREGRRTLRVCLPEGDFFLKLHRGVGWREILKNLARGRLPVLGAADEWRAL